MSVRSDCRYSKSHEWVRALPDGTVLVGISDYAQNSLGDITFVQLPKVGAVLKAGDNFGVIESVKAASDLYSPISGAVAGVNSALDSTPETVNQSAHDDGWMLKLKPADAGEMDKLMSAEDYSAHIG